MSQQNRRIYRLVFQVATLDALLLLARHFSAGGDLRHRYGVGVVETILMTYAAAWIVAFALSRWGELATTRCRAVALGMALAIGVSGLVFGTLRPDIGWRSIVLAAVLFGGATGAALALIAWIEPT